MSGETGRDFRYKADSTVAATGEQRAATLVFRSTDDALQAHAVNLDAGANVGVL